MIAFSPQSSHAWQGIYFHGQAIEINAAAGEVPGGSDMVSANLPLPTDGLHRGVLGGHSVTAYLWTAGSERRGLVCLDQDRAACATALELYQQRRAWL